MIAGASWMCCILSVTEAGQQPEQPRSKTSRQFSTSAVKPKSAAKLSEEFRLRTTNGKGITQIKGKGKNPPKWGILWFWTVSCSYITALLLFLSKIGINRLHLSSSSAPVLILCQAEEIQVGWERWTRGDSPPLPIHTMGKDQNVVGISQDFSYAVPHLRYSLLSIPWLFLRTRRLSLLYSECQSTSQGDGNPHCSMSSKTKAVSPQINVVWSLKPPLLPTVINKVIWTVVLISGGKPLSCWG